MTTLEIANKLVELCRQGKHREAKALYAEDAVSVEAFTPPAQFDELVRNFESRHQLLLLTD